MTSLIEDLLDLSKIEAGRCQVMPARQSAAQIVQDAYHLLESVAQAKRVQLVCEPVADVAVRADPERVFQVFSNLIGNAVKPGTAKA